VKQIPTPRRIVLAVLTSGSYGREVVQGVQDYASRFARHWQFHFEGACNHPEVFHRVRLAVTEWHAHGMLGQLLQGRMPVIVRQSGLPVVNVSTSKATAMPSVLVDDALVGQMAARYLQNLGVRRFAFAGRAGRIYSSQRAEAFRSVLSADGIPCLFFQPNPTRHLTWLHEYRQLMAWLRKLPRPIGILACDDPRGGDVLQACHALGLRVPEDVAVLGIDNDETTCMLSVPSLSSVIVPSRMIGFRAAELLARLMDGAPSPVQPIRLPPAGVATRLSTDVSAVEDPDAAAALRFIHQQVGRPISVRDVLAAVPQSRKTLERRFTDLLGRTPKQEIRRVQIERAQALLAQTDLKIQAVAAQTGFRRYALFVKHFHAQMGLSPSVYRAQNRCTRHPLRTAEGRSASAPKKTTARKQSRTRSAD